MNNPQKSQIWDPSDLPPIYTARLVFSIAQDSITSLACSASAFALKRCSSEFTAKICFLDAGFLSLFELLLKISQELAMSLGHSRCHTGNKSEAFILQTALQSGITKE